MVFEGCPSDKKKSVPESSIADATREEIWILLIPFSTKSPSFRIHLDSTKMTTHYDKKLS